MRLLADENIAPAVIDELRSAGHDVLAVRDVARSATDDGVLALAMRERRIVVTHDRDFGNIIRYPVGRHCGVIFVRLRNQSPSSVARVLVSLFFSVSPQRFRNRLAVVTENETRFYP